MAKHDLEYKLPRLGPHNWLLLRLPGGNWYRTGSWSKYMPGKTRFPVGDVNGAHEAFGKTVSAS